MQKNYNLLAAGLLMTLPVAGFAQKSIPVHELPAEVMATKAVKNAKVDIKKNPLALQSLKLNAKKSPIAEARVYGRKAANKGIFHAPLAAPASPLFGYLAYDGAESDALYNMCEIGLDGSFTALSDMGGAMPNPGGYFEDGLYKTLFIDDSYSLFGIYFFYSCTFDAETFELLDVVDIPAAGLEWYSAALCQNPNGGAFGVFYNEDATAQSFCAVDLEALTKTEVGTPAHHYVGMSSDGTTVYGLADDNNLYQINTNTGEETLVGPTGVAYHGTFTQSFAIDAKTKAAYFCEIDASQASAGLYSVDLTTGAATLVVDWGIKQVFGLAIPAPSADDNAPAAIAEIAAAFEGPATAGTLTFTLPTETFAGAELTGDVNYTVTANGEALLAGTAAAGATVESAIEVEEGVNTFVAIASNAAGESPKAKISVYVGYDEPKAPANVVLNVSAEGEVSLSWDAPTAGVHNGFLGDLTYNVYRSVMGVVSEVATDLTATEFTETIEVGSLATYAYLVEAVNTTQASEMAASNSTVVGNALECPAELAIDEDIFNLFTVIDDNADGKTWSYYGSGVVPCARYSYNSVNEADDWMISPAIKMSAGRTYVIKYKAAAYSSYYPEWMEVTIGQGATIEAQTTLLVAPYDVPAAAYADIEEVEVEFTAPADGEYNVAFHAISDADMFYLDFYGMSVEAGPLPEAPAAVLNLTATPGAQGATEATIAFTAPSTRLNGEALESLTKVTIARDGELIAELTDVTPGAAVEFDEHNLAIGTHKWVVIAYNEAENGPKSTVSAYVGPDVPADITDGHVTDNISSVTITWSAVGSEGQNGGYVNTDEVVYTIYEVADGYLGEALAETTENSIEIEYNTMAGDPTLLYFVVTAKNAAGESAFNVTDAIVVNEPIGVPYLETLPSGGLDQYWWVNKNAVNNWTLDTSMSSNGDNGCVYWTTSAAGEWATLNSAKLTVAGAVNPEVICSVLANDRKVNMTVEAILPSGEAVVLETVNTADQLNEWVKVAAQIPAEVVAAPYFVLSFRAEATGANATVAIDDIQVRDVLDYNLVLDLVAPSKVTKGDAAYVVATVANEGANAAEGAVVNLTVGNEVLTANVPALASFKSVEVTFEVQTSIFDEADELLVEGEVAYDLDLKPADNVASAVIELVASKAATVSDLVADVEDGVVTLIWSAPEASSEELTEDWEANEENVTIVHDGEMFGEWTGYDFDNSVTGGINGITTPYEPYAFGIMNITALLSGSTTDPTTVGNGDNAAYFMFCNYDGASPANDDWMVSPELSGDAQTVSFIGRVFNSQYPETFEVLYSETDNDPSSFVLVDRQTVSTTDMVQYSYDLPVGAKYFAIRYVSNDMFCFFVDDVTYAAGTSAPVAFDVYCDGEYLDTVEEPCFVDANAAAGAHTYAVVAVYESGATSAPVCVTVDTATGIVTLNTESTVNAYTVDGLRAREMKSGLYIANGKKVVIK